MNIYSSRTLELANQQASGPDGHPWTIEHLKGCAMNSDACSGGISWFYEKFLKRKISCHWCCVCHDFLYGVGGTGRQRKMADKLLRDCVAYTDSKKWTRKVGYWLRSRIMYWAVRLFGGKYWTSL